MASERSDDTWEYQVIHLNVEDDNSKQSNDGAASAPPVSSAGGSGGDAAPHPPFSKQYLEQEFPNFYQGQGNQGAAPKHPALQLQGFLNRLGEQGWQLIGLHPVGKFLMMFFKRPRQIPSKTESSSDTTMEQLLARVEQLEQRLGEGRDADGKPPSNPSSE